MNTDLHLFCGEPIGPIKRMNAVNNGPAKARSDQSRGNFDTYSAAGFPYARTHDANFCSAYGGPHTVDITAIFPDFDADENDPASYDFFLTDLYMDTITQSGTKVFYRLGQSIEHQPKKYGIFAPKDNAKWARICEHIILHLNEGWANGHRFGIDYWEIWNEPDLDPDDSPNKRCWGGTKAQFFDLFEVAAKYLKGKFPQLKIGGPALAGNYEWAAEFLAEMHRREVPIDFFSWHRYGVDPHRIGELCEKYRALLDETGYPNAESILNEWNYVRNWDTQWVYSLRAECGQKGASFATAVMCECQNRPLDMLMYYDARLGTAMNGLFDLISLEPNKTYYPYLAFHQMAQLGQQVRLDCNDPDIYALAASDGEKTHLLLTYYNDNDESPQREVTLRFLSKTRSDVTLYLTDKTRDNARVHVETARVEEKAIRVPLKLFDVYHIVIEPRK